MIIASFKSSGTVSDSEMFRKSLKSLLLRAISLFSNTAGGSPLQSGALIAKQLDRLLNISHSRWISHFRPHRVVQYQGNTSRINC